MSFYSQKNYEEDEPQEKTTPRSRPWYSTSNFLLPAEYALYDDLKIDAPQNHEKAIHKNDQTTVESDMDEEGEKSKLIKKDDVNKDANKTEDLKFENKISWDRRGRSTPNSKRINLVNDSYLSDEEVDKTKMKEMVVGNVKVQLDLDLNSVKVRSRWDSDYEGENSEKEASYHKEVDMEIATPEEEGDTSSQGRKKSSPDNVNFNNQSTKVEQILEKKILETQNEFNINPLKDESENHVVSNELQGNLASEYEEFLKMVSFDSNSNQPVANKENTPETWSKLEKEKVSKVEKLTQEVQKPKFEMTDWDKESDHEEKAVGKIPFHKNEPNEEMLLLSEEKVPLKRRKSKKYIFLKKKSEKFTKKEKLPKKLSKNKKKKSEDSSSSDSSSDSYDSECDSDSDESKSCKRRKKRKKISKIKRKYRKDSSSSKSESASESDSDDSKFKKKKTKKRKDKKKKKSDSSDSDGNRQNALLKQLDYKKQLIMKKIEEIDSISERSSKKKSKDGKQKKKKDESFEEADSLEKYIKCIKRKKTELKTDKDKKKSKTSAKGGKNDKESKKKSTSSESDEETIMSKSRRKKEKFAEKKRRDTSESSDSDEKSIRSAKIQNKMSDFKNFKSVEIISKKIKKPKKEKRKNYSSSDSCSNDSFSIEQKKVKKRGGKNKSDDDNLEKEKILAENPSNIGGCSWKENFLLEDTFRIENTCLDVTDTKLEWKQPTAKTTEKIKEKGKESGDWEASSSLEESDQECKTRESWDDDIPFRNTKSEVSNAILEKSEVSKNSEKFDLPFSDIDSNGKRILGESEGVNQIFGSLKTSISNFSFNENSFCGFGQELSRDFFLTERTFSNSEVISEGKIVESCNIESRPFQSVAKASEINKPSKSELYSPGHSDSDVSDMENNIKTEKIASNSNTCSTTKEEVYDPLNSESETSLENAEVELSSIPLPRGSKILLPGEIINFNDEMSSKPQNFFTKSIELKTERSTIDLTSNLPIYTPPKPSFTSTDFSPLEISTSTAIGSLKEADKTAKKQVMSVKSQQKLQSKAASVFQDESDEEASDTIEKTKEANSSRNENLENSKSSIEENIDKNKIKESERRQSNYSRVKRKDYSKKRSKVVEESRERSRERSETRELKRKRSVSKERKSSSNSANDNLMISVSQTKNRSSETIYPISSKEKREIRSDSFEIEPLKSSTDLELVETVQPIPVLTGLGVTSLDRHSWNRSQLPGYSELSDVTGDLIDPSESFDIYPSDDLKFRNRHFDKVCIDRYEDSTDKSSSDKSAPKEEKKKIEKRHSRSKSLSPRKKRRSKTPDKRRSPRNRSPRRRSGSPKRRDKSPYSPRRRSPKRKSPSRRYRNSRSPDRRRKSRSRSPRKRRSSPLRRSRSLSPRKHRSPKRRDSPRRRNSSSRTFSPRESNSPRRENQFIHHYSNSFHNRIPVIGAAGDGVDHDLSPSKMRANSMGFPETVLNESEMNSSFYSREYQSEFMVSNYVEEVGGNNLITLRNPDMDKPTSPERLSLDQRIELELGVPLNSGNQGQNEQYDMPNPACKPFQDMNSVHFQNSYNCENNVNGDAFYQNQNMGVNSEFNNQYYNGHQPQTGYGPFQQYPNSQSVQSSMLQVSIISIYDLLFKVVRNKI